MAIKLRISANVLNRIFSLILFGRILHQMFMEFSKPLPICRRTRVPLRRLNKII